jgi:hypothetical protein
MGEVMLAEEAFAGQFFSKEAFTRANGEFLKLVPQYMIQAGARIKHDKLHMFNDLFNSLQDHKRRVHDTNIARKNVFLRAIGGDTMFIGNEIGEIWLQTRLALAMAMDRKVLDPTGKESNLYDVLEEKNGRLVIPDGVKNIDGTDFTRTDFIKHIGKQNEVNNKMNGIYNEFDRSSFQKSAFGRLMLMYRKYIVPGWNRRWGGNKHNFITDTTQEGFYLTFINYFFGKNGVLTGKEKLAFAKSFKNLKDYEKANMFRAITGGVITACLSVLATCLAELGKDDDDDWYLSMLAYQSNRVLNELRFFYHPGSFLTIANSPFAGLDALEKISSLVDAVVSPSRWDEELQSGRYKGWTRLEKAGLELAGPLKTIRDIAYPEEKLKFFNKN